MRGNVGVTAELMQMAQWREVFVLNPEEERTGGGPLAHGVHVVQVGGGERSFAPQWEWGSCIVEERWCSSANWRSSCWRVV